MGLIGLGTVSIVGMILAVRSSQVLNKVLVTVMWAVTAAFVAGVL